MWRLWFGAERQALHPWQQWPPLPTVHHSLVSQNRSRLQAVKQLFDLRNVVAFAAGVDEADGIAQHIGGGMDLDTQAIF